MPTIAQKWGKAKKVRRKVPKEVVKVTKTIPVKKLSDPVKAGVLAVVRRMINRSAENKVIGNKVEDGVVHNSAIGSADCEPVIPEIAPLDAAVGSTATQRIGDRITPKALTLKGVVSINPEQGTNSLGDLYVRVLVLSQKDIKVGSRIAALDVDSGSLLRPAFPTGATDQVPFNGNTMELHYPVNRDKFRVYYDKIHRIKMTKSLSQDTWDQYSFRWSYKFKELPASLTFDEGNGNWANNFAPFVTMGYAYADGSAPDVTQIKLISHTYSQLTFEDM